MGISTGCAILVGLQGEDMYEKLSPEFQALIDRWGYGSVLGEDGAYDDEAPKPLGLDAFSPWFDCDSNCHYFGIGIFSTYSAGKEIEGGEFDEFKAKVEAARIAFKEATGIDGKLIVTPNVW